MKKGNIIKAVCVAAILAIICTGYYMVTIWRASETEEKDNTDEPYKDDIPDDVVIAGDTVNITVDEFKNCVRILLSMGKSYNEAVSDATHRLEKRYGLYAEALKKGYSATEEEAEEYVKQLKGDIEKAANKDEMSEFINSYGDNGEYWEVYKNQARIDCVLNKYNQDLENEFQSSYKGELYSEKYNDDWDIYYEKLKEDSAKNENFKVVKNVDDIIVDDNS